MTWSQMILVALILLCSIQIVNSTAAGSSGGTEDGRSSGSDYLVAAEEQSPVRDRSDPLQSPRSRDGQGAVPIDQAGEGVSGEGTVDSDSEQVKKAVFEATIFEDPPESLEQILGTHPGSQLWASVDDDGCKRKVRIVSSLKIEDFCDCEAYHNEKVMEKALCPDLHLYIKKMLKELLKGEGGEEEETNFDKMEHRFVFVARPSPEGQGEPEKEEETRLTKKVEEALQSISEQTQIHYYDMKQYKADQGESEEDIQRKIARVIEHKVPVSVLSIKQGAAPRGFVGHGYIGVHDRDGIELKPKYPQVLCHIIEEDTGNHFLRRVWSPPSKEQKDKGQERKPERLKAYLKRVCGIMDLRKPAFRISPQYADSILPKYLLAGAS